jgi:hypothetical protein
MRLLYVDICAKAPNPTIGLIPALLRLSADVVLCYGPGFVDQNELSGGIAKFLEKHGDFDFYVTTFLCPESDESNIPFYNRYTYPSYPCELVSAFLADIAVFLKRSQVPKIVFLNLDVYALSERNARAIEETNGYIVTFANGFSSPLDKIDFNIFSKEEFFTRKKGTSFGLWHDVSAKNYRKFINLGHFVAESEFSWTSLNTRRDKAVVPGQLYVRREAARRNLAREGILARSGRFKFLMSLMDHTGLRPYTRPSLQALFKETYIRDITSSRYAYTEGSSYDRPIRKFFEIPAVGTVLLCTPCAGFELLGFSNRSNAVAVAADSIGDAVKWLRGSPSRAQAIADAGRQLVWQRHSLHARAEQLAQCLKSIKAGLYCGSNWCDGQFTIEQRRQ